MTFPLIESAPNNHATTDRTHLLEVLQLEKKDVYQLAEEFYDQRKFSEAADLGFCQRIIEVIDKIITAGDWDSSLFLRMTIKPLRELRQQVQTLMDESGQRDDETAMLVRHDLNEDDRLVFVSLFQAEGHDLKQWAVQLRSLEKCLSGRPVYPKEEQVQNVIRTGINQDSESQAYVVMAIQEHDLEQVDHSVVKPRIDRFGNALLLLKTGVITSDHIAEFVHAHKRYRWVNGRLFLQK